MRQLRLLLWLPLVFLCLVVVLRCMCMGVCCECTGAKAADGVCGTLACGVMHESMKVAQVLGYETEGRLLIEYNARYISLNNCGLGFQRSVTDLDQAFGAWIAPPAT